MESSSSEDIRVRRYLAPEDILNLNFIRRPAKYVFRRHFRTGLRSHIMEVLNPEDVAKENSGVLLDGLRVFPRAVPVKMLRIFRRKFQNLAEAKEEIRRVKSVESYLAPNHIARPSEFLVEYTGDGNGEILLGGLQEYVPGQVLEPWGDLGNGHLMSLADRMIEGDEGEGVSGAREGWIDLVRARAVEFVAQMRKLVLETQLVPDLAGVGNLLLTRSGNIKLVDINNISVVSPDPVVPLDDRGYPVCDKSIAVLFHLEEKLTGNAPQKDEALYKQFLKRERINEVKAAERRFYLSTLSAVS